jgi:flagellar motor protein MotB
MLRRAGDAEWQRAGHHAQRGEQTLWTVAAYLSEHEEEHVAQVQSIARRLALLQSISAGLRLKDHRDIEGRKTFVLHREDDSGEPANEADVNALVDAGLISSNKKFPAATYWLTDNGTTLLKMGQ